MTRNKLLSAAIAVTMAHQAHAQAVDSLCRVKASRDTQAQRRAQARVDAALHRLMALENEARRIEAQNARG